MKEYADKLKMIKNYMKKEYDEFNYKSFLIDTRYQVSAAYTENIKKYCEFLRTMEENRCKVKNYYFNPKYLDAYSQRNSDGGSLMTVEGPGFSIDIKISPTNVFEYFDESKVEASLEESWYLSPKEKSIIRKAMYYVMSLHQEGKVKVSSPDELIRLSVDIVKKKTADQKTYFEFIGNNTYTSYCEESLVRNNQMPIGFNLKISNVHMPKEYYLSVSRKKQSDCLERFGNIEEVYGYIEDVFVKKAQFKKVV